MTSRREARESRGTEGARFTWDLWWNSAQSARRRVLIVAGITSRNHPDYRALYDAMATDLVVAECEVVTFAARGQMGSEGIYSFPSCVEDVLTIANEWSPGEPMALFGRSAGGPIALRCAARLQASQVMVWGAAGRLTYEELFGPGSDGSYLQACEKYGTRMHQKFYQSTFFPEDEICNVKCPVWIGIGDQDEHSSAAEQLCTLLNSKRDDNVLFVIKGARHAVKADGSGWHAMRQILRAWLNVVS